MSVALVHGWGMHAGVWGTWPDALPEAVSLDLPGHGRRPRQERLRSLGDVADDLMTQLGCPAVWLGWSLGGLVALRAALDYPEQVAGVVLIGTSARFVAAPDWPCGMAGGTFRDFADGLEADFEATLNRFTALEVHGSPHAREELAEIRRRLNRVPPPARGTLRDGLALLEETDLRAELPGLRPPALFVAGSRDRLVAPRAVAATAELVAGARREVIAGAGHAPFLSHAAALTRCVRPFVDACRMEIRA